MTANNSGIRPLGGYVLVAVPKAKERSAGGIIIPEDVAEKEKYGTQRGFAVAVGPTVGRTDDGHNNGHAVSEGDEVALARYAGTMIKGNDGEDYRLILDVDVKGIFDGQPAD